MDSDSIVPGSSPGGAANACSQSLELSQASLVEFVVAMVNGSNSASKSATIEVPHGESVPIGCSAASLIPYLINRQIQQPTIISQVDRHKK